MKVRDSIHPFPARMAPEVISSTIDRLDSADLLLDPMCGSGSVVRQAALAGVAAMGRDIDPLAVLMSQSWADPPPIHRFLHEASLLIRGATERLVSGDVIPSWHDDATKKYVDFWFGDAQRFQLGALACEIEALSESAASTSLKVALSRTIITKEHGASLSRDASRSRPHRVRTTSTFDVLRGFERSVATMSRRLLPNDIRAPARVRREDGRNLESVDSGAVDCVITSPPYLNAIDYMRGHRLALVWLGHSVADVGRIRAASVGAERVISGIPVTDLQYVSDAQEQGMSARHLGWLQRYATDSARIVSELNRVCKPERATVVLVVGNSTIRGVYVDNAQLYVQLLSDAGFDVKRTTREIPQNLRSLPFGQVNGNLSKRMREEVVITARR